MKVLPFMVRLRSGCSPAPGRILLAMACVLAYILSAQDGSLAAEIAILKSSSISAYDQAITGFKSTAPAGVIYSEYDLQGDLDQGRKLAKKIRASEASLVVAVGLKAALAARLEIVDIPIVYMMILDPSKHNLTASNMTGTLLEIPADRQFKILRAFLPDLRRVGTLSNSGNQAKLKETITQAAAQSFQLQAFPVESEKEVPQQLRALLGSTDALLLVPDSTVLTNESIGFILETSLAKRVPVIGFSPEFTRLGALLSLSVSYGEVGRETGLLAKRILDGDRKLPAKPIPIERLKITVNLKTARFLGIEFPKDVNHLIDETY
ncbi:MAG TPA: ABC transporter substrate-binding protein [Nitrospira sp.]|nr:ABC transporter substrate-binding protein [Nitrospira sp.]